MTQLITTDLVELDQNLGSSPEDVIRHLAGKVAANGRATEVEGLFADAFAREQKTATGVPGGIAIPHCRSTAVTEPTLVMARLSQPVDFGAKDGPADLIFFIAAPEGADQEHLKLLSKLARSLIKKDFTASLRAAGSEAEVVELVEGALADKPAAAAPAAAAAAAGGATAAGSTTEPATAGAPRPKRLVAVTACPTGIAHTYMAADSLVAAAKEVGVDLQVETQGSSGAKALDPAVIAAADAVIFAVDVDVRGKERFAGMPVINAPVKRGIDEPDKMVQEALAAADNPNARRVPHFGEDQAEQEAEEKGEHFGTKLKKALLTGVSYMIPFVAGGGLLIALGFLLGGYDITAFADKILAENSLFNLPTVYPELAWGPLGAYLGAVMFKIGALSLGFLVPGAVRLHRLRPG